MRHNAWEKDPTTGTVTRGGTTSGGGSNLTTTAVANPKNATVIHRGAFRRPSFFLYGDTATPTVQFESGHATYTCLLTVTDSSGKTAPTVVYAGP